MNETWQEVPRPNLFREGLKVVMEDREWPTKIRTMVDDLESGHGNDGINSIRDVFSEVSIYLNNLGDDGLNNANYTTLREIIDVVVGSKVYLDVGVGDDMRFAAFVPLIWLDEIVGVKNFLDETDGVMKGGILKYLSSADSQLGEKIIGNHNLEKVVSDWFMENDKYLITPNFQIIETKKDGAT